MSANLSALRDHRLYYANASSPSEPAVAKYGDAIADLAVVVYGLFEMYPRICNKL